MTAAQPVATTSTVLALKENLGRQFPDRDGFHALFLASGCPARRSRMEIGASSGQTRLPRRIMKVCSRANWPRRQAWLAPSVKTIQAEPAGNSQRSLRQGSLDAAAFFLGWLIFSMKAA